MQANNRNRVALQLPGRAVASLEILSIKESFLGISALLGFGHLAMHKSLGAGALGGGGGGGLCHATQASAWGVSIKGPVFDSACLRMRCGCLGILLGLVRRPGQEFQSGLCNFAFMQVGF
jgi:hypothetical protein